MNAGCAGKTVRSPEGSLPWERVPYLSALVVCSRQGAIQIHVYLTLPMHRTPRRALKSSPATALIGLKRPSPFCPCLLAGLRQGQRQIVDDEVITAIGGRVWPSTTICYKLNRESMMALGGGGRCTTEVKTSLIRANRL